MHIVVQLSKKEIGSARLLSQVLPSFRSWTISLPAHSVGHSTKSHSRTNEQSNEDIFATQPDEHDTILIDKSILIPWNQ